MRQRRRTFGKGDTLGELPRPLSEERSHGKMILNPGSMFMTDWINRNTLSLFPFTIGLAALRILPANPLRTYLLLQNKQAAGLGDLLINFGQNPTTFASVVIVPGGHLIFEGGATGGAFSPQDDIYILGSVAGVSGVAGEGLWTPSAQEV